VTAASANIGRANDGKYRRQKCIEWRAINVSAEASESSQSASLIKRGKLCGANPASATITRHEVVPVTRRIMPSTAASSAYGVSARASLRWACLR